MFGLKKYRELLQRHTIRQIASYDEVELEECIAEIDTALGALYGAEKIVLFFLLISLFLFALEKAGRYLTSSGSGARGGHFGGFLNENMLLTGILIWCGCCFVWLLRRHYIVAELRRRWYTVSFYIFIYDIKNRSEETNARMLLFDKDDRLNHYYETIKNGSYGLFVLGISLIAAGLCIIAAIMIWPFQGEASNAKVISGFATGVLIDFIGVIFVSMYNRTLESSLQMSSLINDNRKANFGFFIASQIHNADVRDQTLSKMTANMFSKGNEEQKTEEKQE